ncbi:MAG: hypothetical protein WCI39_07650 [Gallionellaceae bacterium]
MEYKQCVACGQPFKRRPQVPQQSYCSAPSCQRERKRQWQRLKLQTDPDYQDNQNRAQKAWLERNPNYSRQYRDSHPEYVNRNRDQQRERVAKTKNPAVAKMDVSAPPQAFPSGIYRLRPVLVYGVAKMDAWTVEITRLSDICPCAEAVCKEMT